MANQRFLVLALFFGLFSGSEAWIAAQQNEPHIHVIVDMVQLNVAVTDDKGNYITGLHPQDFEVTEDGMKQKIATFGEGNEPTRRLVEPASLDGMSAAQGAGRPHRGSAPGKR